MEKHVKMKNQKVEEDEKLTMEISENLGSDLPRRRKQSLLDFRVGPLSISDP